MATQRQSHSIICFGSALAAAADGREERGPAARPRKVDDYEGPMSPVLSDDSFGAVLFFSKEEDAKRRQGGRGAAAA